MLPELLTVFLLIAVSVLVYIISSRKRRAKYPPGPSWSLPLVGHILHLGREPHKTLTAWKSAYGPIVSLNFGSFPTVAISDYRLIREALEDPAFSGRPEVPMFKDRSGGARHGILFSDKSEWTENRRFTLRHLKDFGFGKVSMESILHEEVTELIETLRAEGGSPISLRSYLNAAVINTLWLFIAGERFQHGDPRLNEVLNRLSANIAETNELASLCMFVPWLTKTFPKASGYTEIMKDLEPMLDFLRLPLRKHRESRIKGQPRDLMDAYIEKVESCQEADSCFYKDVGERVMLTVFLDLFAAGAETTNTTLCWTFLYLALNPEVQEKLYCEIQAVVGTSRLPSLNDKAEMLYTEAVLMEVLRISSLAPLGLFHNTLSKVRLGGYRIPANTMILTNLYSCHFDREYWGDPEVFRPERFLSQDQSRIQKHEAFLGFSSGKRVCLGESLARAELFLFTTVLVQRFRVVVDPSGPRPSLDPVVSIVLSPQPHRLVLTERLT